MAPVRHGEHEKKQAKEFQKESEIEMKVSATQSELQAVLTGQRTWHVETANVFDGLAMLPDSCIHTVVTSPPYWGLRSYLANDHQDKALELGSEKTPEEFIANMVAVFRECKRVLREDGVLWCNIGDSYATGGGAIGRSPGGGEQGERFLRQGHINTQPNRMKLPGYKAGDLVGIPWMLAFALRADGWYLRNDCIWHKAAPMPESVNGWRWEQCRVKVGSFWTEENPHPSKAGNGKVGTGMMGSKGGRETILLAEFKPCPGCPKCIPNGGLVLRKGSWRHTRAHEYVFMLTKSDRYYCDSEAVAERCESGPSDIKKMIEGRERIGGKHKDLDDSLSMASKHTNIGQKRSVGNGETRNPRSVIKLSNEPFKGSHFATFPTKLIDPLLKASTSEKGCCPACGMPWSRIIEKTREATRPATNNKRRGKSGQEVGNADPERHISRTITKGWKVSCACNAGEPVPCIALDPFSGAGTTVMVARRLGLRAIGFELSEAYAEMSRKRIKDDLPLMN